MTQTETHNVENKVESPQSAPVDESTADSAGVNPFLISEPEPKTSTKIEPVETNPFANPFLIDDEATADVSQQMSACSLDTNNNPNDDDPTPVSEAQQ